MTDFSKALHVFYEHNCRSLQAFVFVLTLVTMCSIGALYKQMKKHVGRVEAAGDIRPCQCQEPPVCMFSNVKLILLVFSLDLAVFNKYRNKLTKKLWSARASYHLSLLDVKNARHSALWARLNTLLQRNKAHTVLTKLNIDGKKVSGVELVLYSICF